MDPKLADPGEGALIKEARFCRYAVQRRVDARPVIYLAGSGRPLNLGSG
jgi:hypothetical protein